MIINYKNQVIICLKQRENVSTCIWEKFHVSENFAENGESESYVKAAAIHSFTNFYE